MLEGFHVGGWASRVLLAAAMWCVAGCSGRQGPAETVTDAVPVPAADYDRHFLAAADALTERGFVLERRDHRFGVVSTKGRLSPTLFEPWHGDNHSLDLMLESTLNTQRRVVTVTLEPATSAGGFVLRVEAVVERSQAPLRRLNGATFSGSVFVSLAEVPAEWRERGIPGQYWQPLGRDPLLERELLGAIIAGASKE